MELPRVSLIISTWLESNKRYLDLCVRSVKALNYDHSCLDIIVIGRDSYLPQYEGVRSISGGEKFSCSQGVNLGFRCANQGSKYFLTINDDTILTSNSLLKMVRSCGDQLMIINPISPCDNGLRHTYSLNFGFDHRGTWVNVPRRYTYEDTFGYHDSMMKAESLYNPGFIHMDWLCMYATLIPRSVHELVGEFDEKFQTGQDDLDYSWRARDKGVMCMSQLDALIWHFGGVSADSSLTPEIRRENVRYFKSKWLCLPPNISESFLDSSIS